MPSRPRGRQDRPRQAGDTARDTTRREGRVWIGRAQKIARGGVGIFGVIAQGQRLAKGGGRDWITRVQDQPQEPDEDGNKPKKEPHLRGNLGTCWCVGPKLYVI